MDILQRLSHTNWECKSHVVCIPKYRRKYIISNVLNTKGFSSAPREVYFFFLRAIPARPARPVPKSSMVAGSGTGLAILTDEYENVTALGRFCVVNAQRPGVSS